MTDAPQEAGLVPGATIANRFCLERCIGQGGMGQVWAARNLRTGKLVALKLLARVDSEADRQRIVREARVLGALDHPNVCEVLDVVDHHEAPVLVLPLLRGQTLSERIAQRGQLSVREVCFIGAHAAAGVAAAHAAGIVHRDLKPANIFIEEAAGGSAKRGGRAEPPEEAAKRGGRAEPPEEASAKADPLGGEHIRVLDFGIAKVSSSELDAETITATGALLGTPAYMSPEQVFGERNIDQRADVWSLGLVLYEALTGVLPTRAENVGQVIKKTLSQPFPKVSRFAPDTPDELVQLVDSMLKKNPKERLPDLRPAIALMCELAGIAVLPSSAPAIDLPSIGQSGDATEEQSENPPMRDELRSTERSSSFLSVVVVGVLLFSGAIGATSWWTLRKSEASSEPPARGEASESPPQSTASSVAVEPLGPGATEVAARPVASSAEVTALASSARIASASASNAPSAVKTNQPKQTAAALVGSRASVASASSEKPASSASATAEALRDRR
ncbi:MAG: serine/threonine-protein kinase [Polyangiaceae bacterium]